MSHATSADYRADIDGLRALAVTLVMAFHLDTGLNGGFIGVDVFFVVSGFLITRSLLKDRQPGAARIAAFWTRRLRRIFPAAAFVTLCCIGLGACLMLPADFASLARSALWQQAMAANVFFWRDTDYFAENSTKPLLHTWSLAVEEQFYAFYPLLLTPALMSRRGRLVAVLLAVAVGSFALSVFGVARYPGAAFYLLPTRAWELLIGCLLAVMPGSGPGTVASATGLSLMGLGMIVGPSLLYTSNTPFPGAAALLPCAGTALFIWANEHAPGGDRNPVTRLATLPVVRHVGLISYSLYLWHWPLIVFWGYWFGPPWTWPSRIFLALASIALADLTWRFVEQPFRRTQNFRTFRSAVTGSLCATAVTMAVAWLVLAREGMPGRIPARARTYLDVTEAERNAARFEMGYGAPVPGHDVARWLEPDAPAGCRPDFLVWGDSHACSIADTCRQIAAEKGLHGLLAYRTASVPLLGAWKTNRVSAMYRDDAQAWSNGVVQAVRDLRIPAVILMARWETLTNGQITDVQASADVASATPGSPDAFPRSLRRTVEALHEAGASVWLIEPIPTLPVAPIRWSVWNAMVGLPPPRGISRGDYDSAVSVSVSALRDCANIATVVPTAEACFDGAGFARVADAEHCYYWDNNHVTGLGADRLLRPVLDRVFMEIAQASTSE